MCKETVSTDDVFIHSVEAAPEPMCVLATRHQIIDLERFCTGENFSVMSVDPTFNLGSFYVTPLTYKHKLARSKKKNGSHPLLLGPIFVHQTKTFHAFHYFASTLVRLNSYLKQIKAFVTDGESELIKAFQNVFHCAVHLRCSNHLKQNIKEKLCSLKVPSGACNDILADIFGAQVGTHFEKGLVDAQDEATFSVLLKSLQEKWSNLEMSGISEQNMPQFHAWFTEYKAPDIIASELPAVRIRAGI